MELALGRDRKPLLYLLVSLFSYDLFSALLTTAPLLFIGTLSYSIYMTHALVFIVIDNLAEYVLHMPTSEIYRAGMGWLQVFKTPLCQLDQPGGTGGGYRPFLWHIHLHRKALASPVPALG